jgi:hypothetical protein
LRLKDQIIILVVVHRLKNKIDINIVKYIVYIIVPGNKHKNLRCS